MRHQCGAGLAVQSNAKMSPDAATCTHIGPAHGTGWGREPTAEKREQRHMIGAWGNGQGPRAVLPPQAAAYAAGCPQLPHRIVVAMWAAVRGVGAGY